MTFSNWNLKPYCSFGRLWHSLFSSPWQMAFKYWFWCLGKLPRVMCVPFYQTSTAHKTPFHIKWITRLIMVQYEWRGMIHQPVKIQMHTNTKSRQIVAYMYARISVCLLDCLLTFTSHKNPICSDSRVSLFVKGVVHF